MGSHDDFTASVCLLIPRLRRETLEMGKVLQMLRNQSVTLAEYFSSFSFAVGSFFFMSKGQPLPDCFSCEKRNSITQRSLVFISFSLER